MHLTEISRASIFMQALIKVTFLTFYRYGWKMHRSKNQVFLVIAFLCTIACSYVQCGKCESALFKGIWWPPFNKEETLHSKVNENSDIVPC